GSISMSASWPSSIPSSSSSVEFSTARSSLCSCLVAFEVRERAPELRRLVHRLRERGTLVVLSDMREYLNLEVPLDIGGFLVSIAGAFGEGLADPALLSWDPIKEGYWARFRNFLTNTKVELASLDLDLAPSGLKGNLRDDPSFRPMLKAAMDG